MLLRKRRAQPSYVEVDSDYDLSSDEGDDEEVLNTRPAKRVKYKTPKPKPKSKPELVRDIREECFRLRSSLYLNPLVFVLGLPEMPKAPSALRRQGWSAEREVLRATARKYERHLQLRSLTDVACSDVLAHIASFLVAPIDKQDALSDSRYIAAYNAKALVGLSLTCKATLRVCRTLVPPTAGATRAAKLASAVYQAVGAGHGPGKRCPRLYINKRDRRAVGMIVHRLGSRIGLECHISPDTIVDTLLDHFDLDTAWCWMRSVTLPSDEFFPGPYQHRAWNDKIPGLRKANPDLADRLEFEYAGMAPIADPDNIPPTIRCDPKLSPTSFNTSALVNQFTCPQTRHAREILLKAELDRYKVDVLCLPECVEQWLNGESIQHVLAIVARAKGVLEMARRDHFFMADHKGRVRFTVFFHIVNVRPTTRAGWDKVIDGVCKEIREMRIDPQRGYHRWCYLCGKYDHMFTHCKRSTVQFRHL